VREAYRFAHEQGATGPVLNRLFQGALKSGKRVRSETELGTRPMSVASAGVKLAERILWKTKRAQGAGVGGRHDQRASGLSAPGSWDRAAPGDEPLAGPRGTSWPSSSAERSSAGVEWEQRCNHRMWWCRRSARMNQFLRRDIVERAMAARGNRALFLMDLGVPRNIDPSVGELYNVYVLQHR